MSISTPKSYELIAKQGTPIVAALIATCNRSKLLSTRSLPSIAGQIRQPDLIVIVDDSSTHLRFATRCAVEACQAQFSSETHAELLQNKGTHGASGAWNTGLGWLANNYPKDRVIVALLDDDDAWEPDHLNLTVQAIEEQCLDFVASGILRLESLENPGRPQLPPRELRVDDFLVGNPHIQGSNIVIRLGVMLEVGEFDEGLPSCTDRDLCIRLAELGTVRYGPVAEITVRHYAETSRPRLSTAGSRSKHAGLDGFWRKYRDRMTDEQRKNFLERGERLFLWQPPGEEKGKVWFVVGITADAGAPERVAPLLNDLSEFSKLPGVSGLDVVVLENGPLPENGSVNLRETVECKRLAGLHIWFIPLEWQQKDAKAGAFGIPFERGADRAGIVTTRTMLQAYLYVLGRRRPGSVVWVLDDDKRLAPLLESDESERLVDSLLRLRIDDVAVAIGVDIEAPPIPVLATLRGELHDLKLNLDFLSSVSPDADLPDRSQENRESRRRSPDLYHDLTAGNGQHLETPLWWEPRKRGETALESFLQIAVGVSGLLNGRPLFRALQKPEPRDVVAEAFPSTQRGGCTWILNIEALIDTPNVAAVWDGDPCRRSDMLWASLLDRHFGHRVLQVPIAVVHDRGLPQVNDPWSDLMRDVRGHALNQAMIDLLKHRDEPDKRSPMEWTVEDEEYFLKQFQFHLLSRINTFERSVVRIRTIAESINRMLDPHIQAALPWWLHDPELKSFVCLMREAISDVLNFISSEKVENWLVIAKETPTDPVREFLHSLPDKLDAWSTALQHRSLLRETLDKDRMANAKAGVSHVVGATDELKHLGSGSEGVVLTDGKAVYKWFDAWPLRQRPRARAFLKGLVGRLDHAKALPRLDLVSESAGQCVARYPYEPSEPYSGGHGPALYQLLQECREYDLVCNNLHPNNLRVVGERVVMIDVGADIVQWSAEGWLAMVRRAWLCWRWAFRSDLKDLMTRSLREPELPELEGVQALINALDEPGADEQCRVELVRRILASGSCSVLDYGCGKGKLIQELGKPGIHSVGYDPDSGLEPRWNRIREANTSVSFGTRQTLDSLKSEGTRFDTVVCSLVLCELDDGSEYEAALADLRCLVADNGTVYVAVCNPLVTFGGSTPFEKRPLNHGRLYDENFAWTGNGGQTGRIQRDIHRPLRVLERDLLRSGLLVKSRWQSRSIDLHRFEPASDIILLQLGRVHNPPPITLAIKTCAMEWRTLEEQVRHLVGQLEVPEVFAERILVVDNRVKGFSRAHDEPNVEALDDVIERLLQFRLIDRVVRCSVNQAEIRGLNQRWFGIETASTHAQDGSPVAAALAMFEAVHTPWLLQVDSDLLVHRSEPRDAAIGRLVSALEQDSSAVTISLSIAATKESEPKSNGPLGQSRAEVRGGLFHMARLRTLLPLPNRLVRNVLLQSWHRSLDQAIRAADDHSLRLADPHLGFIHPPNHTKERRDEWMTILDRCTSGQLPASQIGHVELNTSVADWLGPPRLEHFVVIFQGHNVPVGRMRRAFESLQRQKRSDWGAIVIDDGSDSLSSEFLRLLAPDLGSRWTVMRTPIRRGGMANLVWAVRHICSDPDSIIVLLDADDTLIGDDVLGEGNAAYFAGADLTVGKMLRTDKEASYQVCFENSRQRRGGGNVWQHLRTFRKWLFDAIPDDALRIHGQYVEVAQDWAYMLPMVEMAKHPVALDKHMYLYEPSGEGKHDQKEWREGVITRIVSKPGMNQIAYEFHEFADNRNSGKPNRRMDGRILP